jgi:hypothetical protein
MEVVNYPEATALSSAPGCPANFPNAARTAEFQDLAERIRFQIPGEQEKRHGQAIAASLPAIPLKEVPNVS